MSAPLTALCLVIEFTHRGATLLVPTVIALGLGSARRASGHKCARAKAKPRGFLGAASSVSTKAWGVT